MSVTLTYGPRLIESCDAIWTANANVTASIETTIKKQGSGSAKLVIAAGFTTGVAGYKAITSLSMVYATQIRFWIRSSIDTVSGDLQFLIDNTAGCVSPQETLNIGALVKDTWSQQTLTLATPANLTAVIALGLNVAVDNGAQNVYIDKIELVTEARTFSNELSVVGFDNPENEEGFPDTEAERLLDASWYKQPVLAATRDITIDLGVVSTIAEQIFLRNWTFAQTTQQITYASETVDVVSTISSFPVERMDGIKLAKRIILNCKEKTARLTHVIPSSWQ
jgi:hypothetical protein